MDKKITLTFRLDIDNPDSYFSLLRLVLKRVEQLEEQGIPVEFMELRMFPSPGSSRIKEAHIKIDSPDCTVNESSRSFRWDDAFLSVFEKVCQFFFKHDPGLTDYCTESAGEFALS